MEGTRLIRTIRLENILSFGPNTPELPLEPLNVFIGPNASGKSNVIEALSLLHAAPRDLQEPIHEGGGVREWLWKGEAGLAPTATVEVTHNLFLFQSRALRYRLSFTADAMGRFYMEDEVIEDEEPQTVGEEPYFYYRYQRGAPVIKAVPQTDSLLPSLSAERQRINRVERSLMWQDVKRDQSILSQMRDRYTYPELWDIATSLRLALFYRDLRLGRDAPIRRPQNTNLLRVALLEDASNLGVVLSNLLNQPDVKEQILERMRSFYPSFRDVTATIDSGTVQIFFHEKGLRNAVPATRLSDGSLRYLCLLVVLLAPIPPSVVCIEEPELGLHPDIIPEVAKLLVEASKRCQLFVTTHSDILVDALSDVPEAVVVCEKVNGATELRRLDRDELGSWLEEYRLGELWSRGEIGGNRW